MEILVEELKLRGYFPNWRDYQIEHVFGKQIQILMNASTQIESPNTEKPSKTLITKMGKAPKFRRFSLIMLRMSIPPKIHNQLSTMEELKKITQWL